MIALREVWPGEATVLAELQERSSVAGFAHVFPPELALYVVPEQWGQGVADVLYERALERLRAFGADRCHLWVLEENRRARRFYEKWRWRENGETRIVPFPPNPLDVGYSLHT
jgi:GNAT superfamily N-acetyltransferase